MTNQWVTSLISILNNRLIDISHFRCAIVSLDRSQGEKDTLKQLKQYKSTFDFIYNRNQSVGFYTNEFDKGREKRIQNTFRSSLTSH